MPGPGTALMQVAAWSVKPVVIAPPTDADAIALIARMDAEPDARRKLLINDTLVALKAAGLWNKFDALYMTAAHDAQAGRVNWRQNLYNLVPVNAPSFAIDQGYAGDGSSAYLDTGFDPTTAVAPKFVRDSACIGVFSLSAGRGTTQMEFGNSTTNLFINPWVTGNLGTTRVNGTVSSNFGTTTAFGHCSGSRVGAANHTSYKDGAPVLTTAGASIAPVAGKISMCKVGGNFSGRRIAVGHIGSGLVDAEELALYNIINTYLKRVGAV